MNEQIELPAPDREGGVPLGAALEERRSVRDFAARELSLESISQLLWAAQGVTDPRGFRTAPSAGGLYPLETFLVVGEVNGLDPGLYHYEVGDHALAMFLEGDLRNELASASLGQAAVADGAVVIVFAAEYERTAVRYGERARRYVHMEIGHAGQNLYLQAVSLGLGTVAIGAFDDAAVSRVLQLPEELAPLYIMPVGFPSE